MLLGAALVVAACSGGDAEQLDFDPTPVPTTPVAGDTTTDEVAGDTVQPPSPDPTNSDEGGDEGGAAAGEITIHADSARPLDRRLFGTNVPAWLGPDKLADPAFQAATTALGTTLLRFPGGSWSNEYDWLACERGDEPDCFATWAARSERLRRVHGGDRNSRSLDDLVQRHRRGSGSGGRLLQR